MLDSTLLVINTQTESVKFVSAEYVLFPRILTLQNTSVMLYVISVTNALFSTFVCFISMYKHGWALCL